MSRYMFAAVVVLIVVACKHQPTTPRGPSSADGLTLSVAVARTQPQRGDLDTVIVTLTNTNPDTVSLTVGGCPFLFYVTDAYGATVVPAGGEWACISVIAGLQLVPGGHQSRTFVWVTPSFPPGLYSVYGTFTAQGVQLATSVTSVMVH